MKKPLREGSSEVRLRLYEALLLNKTKLLKLLIDGGVSVNFKFASGLTPLMEACLASNRDVVKLLLDNGADIKTRDHRGLTVFHYGFMRESRKIIDLLEDYRSKKGNRTIKCRDARRCNKNTMLHAGS
ncbi:Hypothetical predicted protein [Mytilus galloprovincialis]|uniref:Ankyrin repeat domain-containing protein n=1 Tax=Mytilus galloprovincialis TaxID=29158 RepID=A0A8B6DB17_MYTGA|nr:Hypothetical predicted protein [Mytilus galloprovincialis]VDI29387.1 Hypothetical predicted protein [Mytilus galloprovincialis]